MTPTAGFEKTNPNWQLQQLGRRVGEWVELQLAKITPPTDPSRARSPQYEFAPWFLEFLFWVIVVLAIAGVGWQLYRLLSPYFATLKQQTGWFDRSSPSEPPAPTLADWLRRAREQQQRGNYSEACRALYMAALQRLNDANLVPHQPSRTDGEYLRLIQTLPQTQPYRVLIRTHEQVCFGNGGISADLFEQCQQAYQEIAES